MLCLLTVLSLLPINTNAALGDEQMRIRQQIRDVYWKTLSATGMESLHGYCGTMAGWELYYMGITEDAITQNGNQMYDVISTTDRICPGYAVQCYPVSQYTIEEALNTITNCGKRDAYNIMVGFQWTNTAAGSIYGHVAVIHAVLDGIVYFSEGFSTPFQADPSQSMECTISEFANYYDSWASFEGMIHFGDGNNIVGCDTFGCDLFVTTSETVTLQTIPSATNTEYGRSVLVGERMYADALCQNEAGELYYRVWEDGLSYYVPALQAEPELFTSDGLTVSDIALPAKLRKGQDHTLSGVVRSRNSRISNISITVTNSMGEAVVSCDIPKDSYMVDLSANAVNTRIDVSSLTEGNYTYWIYCDLSNHYSSQGQVIENIQRVLLGSSNFSVGSEENTAKQISVAAAPRAGKNGWQYENGSWYYYESGACRTGWFCYEGVDYYLQEDGSAATGWQNINGKNRYFSETGAMRTGWLETPEGTYYMLSNGAPAMGLITVENTLYFFGEDGALGTESTVEYKGASYAVTNAGVATLMP